MSSSPAIATDDLTKRYGTEVAVDGLDLTVPRGAVYGFLGPNGAGKTTTIRMLATLTRPTSGTARVAGAPVSDRTAVTPHLGYLPEEPPLYDELTGREQLEYTAGLRDIPEAAATERIDALLDRFDLAADADKRISGYSKGMKQKTGIIAAILHEPAVVLLDEPTSGLDPRAARTVRETITDLAESDTTVLLSTHILPVVDELADRVGVVFDGELVAEGAPDDLKRRAAAAEGEDEGGSLEDAFLSLTEEHPGERGSEPERERAAVDGAPDDGDGGDDAPADGERDGAHEA